VRARRAVPHVRTVWSSDSLFLTDDYRSIQIRVHEAD
jgi:hypothetical protein